MPHANPPVDHLSAAPPAPRFATGWMLLAYAVATLALGFPALGGGFLVAPHSDQYIAGYAFREFAAASLRAGVGFPLWNPYLLGGLPYVAAMHGDIFYPTFLLRLLFSTDVAMTWGFMLHLFLAGVFTYVFLRRCGIGFWGALLGGAAYMMSGPVASLVSPGHDGKLYVSALLPLALWILVAAVRDGRRWGWGALAITVGLGVLTPHPQLLQYLLLCAGAFALYLALGGLSETPLPRRAALRRLGFALGAVLLGAAIGAIQFLPVQEYVAWSPRAGGRDYAYATTFSMPPEELINVYLPQFSGILDGYWGRNGIHFHSEYFGAVVLVLAGAAFFTTALTRAERGFRLFWVGAFVVAMLWALGGATPFFRLVYELVPGTKFFRAPDNTRFVATMATAALAAIGTERLLRGGVSRRYLIGWLVAGLAVAVLATAGTFTAIGLGIADEQRSEMVRANAPSVIGGAWRSLLFVALVVALGLARRAGRVGGVTAAGALAALVVADLWSVERLYWQFSPPASVIYAADPTIEYMRRQAEPGRVLPLLFPGAARRDPFLGGDALMHHRVRSVLGYHGNELRHYQELGGEAENWNQIGNPNFWALTNLRYILANVAELPIPGARTVVGPVRNAAGSTVWLHELDRPNPLAWVAPVIVKAPDEQVLPTVLNPQFDVRRAALFDTSAAVPGQVIDALPAPAPITVRTRAYGPGRIELELSGGAPEGSALLVSENYYPGWAATVDGKPATVGRADVALLGVALPAGGRAVVLTFRDPAYGPGKAITLAALGLSLLLLALGVGAERRRG
ncbi:MAG TPA: hypothetical protein VNA89_09020 [Gemmatimonadaceae bacterium]|nr:hypothetical protein [Gemmatimonadaceae bacterium]